MIIKYTFEDNDFTQIIEKYIEEFGPFYSLNYDDLRELDLFKKLTKQYDDYNDKYIEEKDITKEECNRIKARLLFILTKNFKNYIRRIQPTSNWRTDGFDAKHLNEDKDYILDNIKVSIVKSIPDQWENGEVLYYIANNQKYIIM